MENKVWVNGTFDVLHIGHIRLILHAASLGVLRVGIDTDERVRSKKGIERPFNKLDDRMEFLSAIAGVDSVVSFDTDDELRNCIKYVDNEGYIIDGSITKLGLIAKKIIINLIH